MCDLALCLGDARIALAIHPACASNQTAHRRRWGDRPLGVVWRVDGSLRAPVGRGAPRRRSCQHDGVRAFGDPQRPVRPSTAVPLRTEPRSLPERVVGASTVVGSVGARKPIGWRLTMYIRTPMRKAVAKKAVAKKAVAKKAVAKKAVAPTVAQTAEPNTGSDHGKGMTLRATRDRYAFYTGKASDIVRQFALAAVALIWIFRGNTGTHLPSDLLVVASW